MRSVSDARRGNRFAALIDYGFPAQNIIFRNDNKAL